MNATIKELRDRARQKALTRIVAAAAAVNPTSSSFLPELKTVVEEKSLDAPVPRPILPVPTAIATAATTPVTTPRGGDLLDLVANIVGDAATAAGVAEEPEDEDVIVDQDGDIIKSVVPMDEEDPEDDPDDAEDVDEPEEDADEPEPDPEDDEEEEDAEEDPEPDDDDENPRRKKPRTAAAAKPKPKPKPKKRKLAETSAVTAPRLQLQPPPAAKKAKTVVTQKKKKTKAATTKPPK